MDAPPSCPRGAQCLLAAAAMLWVAGTGAARAGVDATAPPADVDASRLVHQVCAACHGVEGNSGPGYPVLAGQGAAYLYDQLRQFAAQGRRPEGGVMGAVAVNLSEPQMRAAADYFSRQALVPAPASAQSPGGKGATIFYEGIAQQGVPACASCHGVRGEGLPPKFPRLAGQHAWYLAQQLERYRDGTRITDRKALMRHVGEGLSGQDIAAVAQFAAQVR